MDNSLFRQRRALGSSWCQIFYTLNMAINHNDCKEEAFFVANKISCRATDLRFSDHTQKMPAMKME